MAPVKTVITIIVLCLAVGCHRKAVSPPLIEAARAGDTRAVTNLLRSGTEVDSKDERGQTALMAAAAAGHADIVRLLIDHAADVNAQTTGFSERMGDPGMTALMFAAESGQTKCAEILLDSGANVNARTNLGSSSLYQTALWYSVAFGQGTVAPLLLARGSETGPTVSPNYFPLELAVRNKLTQTVKLLLDKGANPNIRGMHNTTPLMTAVILGESDTVKILLAKGADVNARTGGTTLFGKPSSGNETILTLSKVVGKNPEVTRLLIEAGAKE